MLKGKNINLRLMRQGDLETYIEMSHNIEARGEFFPLQLNSESGIRKRFAEDGFWSDAFHTMIIADKDRDRMLGTVVSFKPVFYQDSVELGYILYDMNARGKGIMPEAVALFVKYIFEWKNIHRIQIQVETLNIASRRVAEKSGFKHEGTLRHCLISRGKPVDMEIYGLTREDWEAQTTSNPPASA